MSILYGVYIFIPVYLVVIKYTDTKLYSNTSIAIYDCYYYFWVITIYQYWYDHLCDVYIENSKAIIREGSEEERKSAVDTLYTALEGGLLLMHPYMPFLTEELWQRLPRRATVTAPSIMVAEYPEYDAGLDNAEDEAAYERVLGCSKGARSLMGEYLVKEQAKGEFL